MPISWTPTQLAAAQQRLQHTHAWLRGHPPGWTPTAPEQAVLDAAEQLARALTDLQADHPIAFLRLWTAHCPDCNREMDRLSRGAWRCTPCNRLQRDTDPKHPDCRTSQRAVLLELGSIATLVTGSNRAGKTFLGVLLAVLWLYGGDHWAVQCFLQLNGLPADLVPARDNLVWYSSLSNEHNIARQRGAFEELLPPSALKMRWEQKGAFAEVVLAETGGLITFKSDDQGWKKYQGEHVDLCILDEQHEKRVFQEVLSRTGEEHGKSGRTVLTMTPIGRSYVYKEFVVEKAPGHSHTRIVYRDNPHVDTASLDARLSRMDPETRDAKMYGLFTARGGAVFPGFDRAVHVCKLDRKALPNWKKWLRLGGIDFGTRNPFCYLHLVIHPKGKRAHIYREHYQANWKLREHAKAIKAIWKKDREPEEVTADPEDVQGRYTLEEHGVDNSPARKGKGSVKKGLEMLAEMLALDEHGRPWLTIDPSCVNMIKEMEGLTWKPVKDEYDEKGKVETRGPDHAVDTARYALRLYEDEYSA
jgi:phage terminase large subunit-like protein